MLEDPTGEYKQSSTSTFPGYEYFYNQEKSSCMDMSGNPVENSLLYDQDNKKATITIGDTSACYLYFDKWKESSVIGSDLINSGKLWSSGLDGDGYRYAGTGSYSASTTPSNFICFGTTDKSTCTSNPDTYMYRIIGVFNNQLKLIKLTSLTSNYIYAGTTFVQNSESYRLYTNSYLANRLNGAGFLTNTSYSYMQDTSWTDLIDEYSKTSVNTSTYNSSGPNYYNSLTPKQIYLHEYNKSGKSSTKGYWSTYTDKITVMDASDYVLSLGATALNMTSGTYSNRSTLKTSWLFLGNNKYGNTSGNYTTEHTTAFYGVGSSTNYVYSWTINPNGYLYNTSMSNEYASRPVFYLIKDIKYYSGTGTLSNPYILDGSANGKLKVTLTNSDSTLTATFTKGTGNLKKYCINKSSSIANCTWNNITSTSISYTMPSGGTYYVHIIDDAGYIAHSSLTYVTWNSNLTLAENLITYRDLWQSGLEGDGYRYVGSGAVGESTNPNNFICFGTTDKTECTSNQDKYMYRILGVFADASGNNHVKLIKYKQLGTYAWNSDRTTDVSWENSDMYKGLNGNYFLTNTTYNYLQNTTWKNRIENWTWSAVNTKTHEDETNNPDYYVSGAAGIYLNEMNKKSKDTLCKNSNGDAINCDGGEWTTPTGKIGLMYVSDYVLSSGSSYLTIINDAIINLFKTGWMHPSNNDTAKDTFEWTLARGGNKTDYFFALPINSNGGVHDDGPVDESLGVRPTFYLTSDVTSSGGTGTLEDPIIIN